MANTIQLASSIQSGLDTQAAQLAASGWMEGNAGLVKYEGGKEIKIPKITLSGLGNYVRNEGYPEGDLTFVYESMEMTQDRGRAFTFDRLDNDETSFELSATSVAAEFQRAYVIPEIDAYRFSTLAQMAIDANQSRGFDVEDGGLLKELLTDIAAVQDKTGESEIVITMPYNVYNLLMLDDTAAKQLSNRLIEQGGIYIDVTAINGNPVVPVMSNRMYTKYMFNDGHSAEQKAGGFAVEAGAQRINWLLTAKSAPIAVSKTDRIKIFSPDENQEKDSWLLQYRKYHDIWVMDNKKSGIYVNLNAVV